MRDKVALVTGAAGGLGKACALRLASNGIAVGVLDMDFKGCKQVVAQIEAEGGRAIALQASVDNREQVKAAVASLRQRFGRVTILVNNAGITQFADFDNITDESWQRMFDINVKGVFIVTQVVIADMKAVSWGRVINISSSSAQTGSAPQVHYSASKGAVIAMTRSLARALGPYGITVNNIPPGAVMDTPMSINSLNSLKISMEEFVKTIPVGRTGVSADIANACAWLASEETSYVTGQTIGVNGGRVMS